MLSSPPGNPNHVYIMVTAIDASHDQESYLDITSFRTQLQFLETFLPHQTYESKPSLGWVIRFLS
jgi:hypothetical protein